MLEVAELACATFFIVKGPTPSRPGSNTDVALVIGCARSGVRQHSPFFAAHTGELSRDSQVPFSPPSFWQGLRVIVLQKECISGRRRGSSAGSRGAQPSTPRAVSLPAASWRVAHRPGSRQLRRWRRSRRPLRGFPWDCESLAHVAHPTGLHCSCLAGCGCGHALGY